MSSTWSLNCCGIKEIDDSKGNLCSTIFYFPCHIKRVYLIPRSTYVVWFFWISEQMKPVFRQSPCSDIFGTTRMKRSTPSTLGSRGVWQQSETDSAFVISTGILLLIDTTLLLGRLRSIWRPTVNLNDEWTILDKVVCHISCFSYDQNSTFQ